MKTLILILFTAFVLHSCLPSKKSVFIEEPKKEINYIPYYLKVYEADSLYFVEDYQRSYEILDSIFKKYKYNNFVAGEFETYVKTSYLTDHLLGLDEKMKILISTFGYPKEGILSDSNSVISKIYKLSNIEDKEYLKYRNRYISGINLKLRKELIDMVENDQYYRKYYDGDDMMKQRKETDSINEIILRKWFNEGVYPNAKLVGNSTVDGNHSIRVSVLLLHTKYQSRLDFFLPKLKEFMIAGKCSPHVYAGNYDQLSYYSQDIKFDIKYGQFNTTDIDSKDYSKYNKIRKEIGLPSLEYEVWKRKLILDYYKIEN